MMQNDFQRPKPAACEENAASSLLLHLLAVPRELSLQNCQPQIFQISISLVPFSSTLLLSHQLWKYPPPRQRGLIPQYSGIFTCLSSLPLMKSSLQLALPSFRKNECVTVPFPQALHSPASPGPSLHSPHPPAADPADCRQGSSAALASASLLSGAAAVLQDISSSAACKSPPAQPEHPTFLTPT